MLFVSFSNYPDDLIKKSDYLTGLSDSCDQVDFKYIGCNYFHQTCVDLFLSLYLFNTNKEENSNIIHNNNKKRKFTNDNSIDSQQPTIDTEEYIELLKFVDFMTFTKDAYSFLLDNHNFLFKLIRNTPLDVFHVLQELEPMEDMFIDVRNKITEFEEWKEIIFILIHELRNKKIPYRKETLIWGYNTFFRYWVEELKLDVWGEIGFEYEKKIQGLHFIFWIGSSLIKNFQCYYLHLSDNFNRQLDLLENNPFIGELKFGRKFNKTVEILPTMNSLTHLTLGSDFNQNIEPLQNLSNLTHLTFGRR